MGDIANMTSNHGEVNGHRLLRWLRSREEIERTLAAYPGRYCCDRVVDYHAGRADLLKEMADDLGRELVPPDTDVCPRCGGDWKLDHRMKTVCRSCGFCIEEAGDTVDLGSLRAQGLDVCPGCGGMWSCDGCGITLDCERRRTERDDDDGIELDTLPAPGR